ncbi:unnamed protein product [Symbiodinium sp. CCMP2592]|nr:unnamed protein product [Symbiodinium sp. CCMP2592]
MTTGFMVQNIKKLLGNQIHGAGSVLVTDYTYKISASGWGLGLFGLTQKPVARQEGSLPQTEVVLAALCWVPKENTVSIAAAMSSFVHLMQRHDIDTLKVKFVCMDGTDAGKLAACKVLPTLRHQLDLHHVLRAIRDVKVATCGHKSNAVRMAPQARELELQPANVDLFHAVWQSVLCELAATESYAFLAYVQSEVLMLVNEQWRAAWAGGLEAAVPGHNTGTVTQSLERACIYLRLGVPPIGYVLLVGGARSTDASGREETRNQQYLHWEFPRVSGPFMHLVLSTLVEGAWQRGMPGGSRGVCGVLKSHKGAPWLRDKGGDIERLDQAILQAKEQDREARGSGDAGAMARARRDLQQSRQMKRRTLSKWEVDWLRAKADEANALVDKPNASMVFSVVKELTQGATRKKTDGGTRHVMNQQEVEEWKEHFQAIQTGRGEVSENVWEDMESRDVCMELDDPPTQEEVRRAVNAMKRGKAGGEDSMVAEYLKLGESKSVKHVGAMLSERGKAAKRRKHDFKKSVRVKILKAAVKGPGQCDADRQLQRDHVWGDTYWSPAQPAKVEELVGTVEEHGQRLERCELRLEDIQSYRFLRVEHSTSLDKLWQDVESGEVLKPAIRGTAAQVLYKELCEVVGAMQDEDGLKAKAAELSGDKRPLPEAASRREAAEGCILENLVEWVSRDSKGVNNIRLLPGEPSRLVSERIKRTLNWALYVSAKMPNASSTLQIYMDRGPRTRAKGKGDGKGKGKGGKQGGKSKGKGKQGGRK